VEVVCFATNAARRPARLPAAGATRIMYLARARKPLRTSPYRDLPRPGAVIGDQLVTDGVLAWRLGYTFLQYRPRLEHVPAGPRLMEYCGRLIRPVLFTRPG
jgi:predicted HAD superfamily phosphohydrolase YqeG